jgi:PHD/YefM family antitoxin component YafN of YafNO toxin-antitoxin module
MMPNEPRAPSISPDVLVSAEETRAMHLRVETDSLTRFRDHTSELVDRLKETDAPLVLTVDGKAEIVVQNAQAYQHLLERAEHLETVTALKEAVRAVDEGRTRPAAEVMERIRQRHGIPD